MKISYTTSTSLRRLFSFVSLRTLRCTNQRPVRSDCRQYSRYSASTIMDKNVDLFDLTNYNVIGFDLDNTLVRYKVNNMIVLEYEVISRYLVRTKGYSKKHLLKPVEENPGFIQKGLILDLERGNILRILPNGEIAVAAHGTKFLSKEEIIQIYGPEMHWRVTDKFKDNLLCGWNTPLEKKFRALLDYYDMPTALIFARLVDTVDEEACMVVGQYNIWPDILDGLVWMYTRENFASGESEFFNAIQATPDKYIYKSSPALINWLKDLKQNRSLFLLTGSHIDYANHTMSYAFGPNWKEMFDFIVSFAKKPGFFYMDRPFLEIKHNHEEGNTVAREDLHLSNLYSQGNWKDMIHMLEVKHKVIDPRVLYIGDNLLQDIYAPSVYVNCDTIAIVEELLAEDPETLSPDDRFYKSPLWGSYFSLNQAPTIWSDIITRHSKMCIPTIEYLTKYKVQHKHESFTANKFCLNGFHPTKPSYISKNA